MFNTAIVTKALTPTTSATKAKSLAGGAKTSKTKPTHPKTSEMVNNAIRELKERNGSTLRTIKKYISTEYNVDAEKLSPFIKKYLKSAVESGVLVQTNGKKVSGSFKSEPKSTAKKPISAKKPTPPAKPKTTASVAVANNKKVTSLAPKAKRSTSNDKRATAAKQKPTAKKSITPSKAKNGVSTRKAKTVAKPPTKKPKAPRPKATIGPKSKATAKKYISASKK